MATWFGGMVAGALTVAHRVPVAWHAAGALAAIAVQGAGIAGATAGATLWAAFAGFALGGVAHGVKNVLLRTLIHERVPAAAMGRAFAAYDGARNAAELTALAAAGVVVAVLGPEVALLLAGAVPFAIGALALAVVARRVAPRARPRAARRTPSAERALPVALGLGRVRRRLGLPRHRVAEAGGLDDLQRQQRALHARRRDVDPEQVEHEVPVEPDRSSTGMPTSSSEAIEAEACEIAQPWPEKRTSATRSSSTLSWTFSSSPQSGLLSSNSRSGSSSVPQFRGCL